MSNHNDLLNDLGIEVSCDKVSLDDVSQEYTFFWKKIDGSFNGDSNGSYYRLSLYNPMLDRSATFFFNFSISKEMCLVLFEFLIRSHDWGKLPIDWGKLPIDWAKLPISRSSYNKLKYVFGDGFSDFLHTVVQHKLNSNEHVESRVFLFSAVSKIPETSLKTLKLMLSEDSCQEIFEDIMSHPAAKDLAIYF